MKRLVAIGLLLLAACGGSDEVVEGRIVDVQGGINAVESFALATADGERVVFVPSPGATFHGGPLSHIRDHLISGEPVAVFYETRDGVRMATLVEDR